MLYYPLNGLADALSPAQCPFLVVSFSSDWRFPPSRSRELVDALIHAGKPVSYANIVSPFGHDAFLLPDERYNAIFRAFMTRAAKEEGLLASPTHSLSKQEATV